MVHHLGLSLEDMAGVRVAFIPWDPFRVPRIAEAVAAGFGGAYREIAWRREFRTFIAMDGRIAVTSTGIGGPSVAIVMEELSMLGVKCFIRIGTTGAIGENISHGDVIITTGSVRMDGTSTHYAPIEYPAVADYEIVVALVNSARENSVRYHTGITASTDTFYPGQERQDSYTGYVPRRFQGITEEFKKLKVINYEMESSTVLTLGSVFGAKCGVVTGVVVHRSEGEKIEIKHLHEGEQNAVKVGVNALKYLNLIHGL